MNLTAVWKPWYVYRPHQLARRLASSISAPPPGHRLMPVSWGVELWADPAEHVGRSVWTTGVFDLAVSEVLFRLTRPSDFVIDAGANLGYMTLLGAVASGSDGCVLAFEPNPNVAEWLRRNIAHARRHYEIAAIELHAGALGAEAGAATLVLPDPASANDGLAHIAAVPGAAGAERMVQVAVAKLDDVIGGQRAGMMKVDVEGHEAQVLEGAAHALHAHRIRHVVFEDHEGAGSRAMALLRAAGYEIFSIGWSMRGPVLAPAADGSLASRFEAPSYLATTETRSALEACARAGWMVLQRQARTAAEVVEA
jgi:FkbM family methyltransferase